MSVDLRGVADMRASFEAYGLKTFPRAVQYALNRIAETASKNFSGQLPKVLSGPAPFTKRGISFRRSKLDGANLDTMSSSMVVLPVQSTYLKYILGDGPNTRRPGDVGLARKDVWLPSTDNIAKTMGIRSKGGALPAGAAARILARRDEKLPKKPKRVRGMSDEAWDAYDLAWKKRRAAQKRWGVFSGQITVKGQKVDAIIARPPVKMVVKNGIGPRTEALRKAQERANPRLPGLNWQRMFFNRKGQVKLTPALYPADVPRILFLKRPSAEYQPIAQQAWLRSAHDAAKLLRPTLEIELAEKMRHEASKAWKR